MKIVTAYLETHTPNEVWNVSPYSKMAGNKKKVRAALAEKIKMQFRVRWVNPYAE